MSENLEKLKLLRNKLEQKLQDKSSRQTNETPPIATTQKEEKPPSVRLHNLARFKFLYQKLDIAKKVPEFETIFDFKAMNLSGIGLKEEDFGEVREGKYIQIISITYEPDKNGKKRAKNVSLGYFGKAQNLEEGLKSDIIEFVLRWRYEKAFQNVDHYEQLLAKLDRPSDTLL